MTTMGNLPEVVSPEQWQAARKELLAKEEEHTRARDRVNADRRRLPMVRIDKPYTFEGPNGTFPWYSSYGSDFNYDFHATVDERVAPVQIFHLTETELAAVGMSYDQNMRGDWPGLTAFLRVGDEIFHTYSTFGRGVEEFHNGNNYLDLTVLGRQEAWEEPKGRAELLGLHVGGPNMRLPDEYDV